MEVHKELVMEADFRRCGVVRPILCGQAVVAVVVRVMMPVRWVAMAAPVAGQLVRMEPRAVSVVLPATSETAEHRPPAVPGDQVDLVAPTGQRVLQMPAVTAGVPARAVRAVREAAATAVRADRVVVVVVVVADLAAVALRMALPEEMAAVAEAEVGQAALTRSSVVAYLSLAPAQRPATVPTPTTHQAQDKGVPGVQLRMEPPTAIPAVLSSATSYLPRRRVRISMRTTKYSTRTGRRLSKGLTSGSE
jgi:hypothetical protein